MNFVFQLFCGGLVLEAIGDSVYSRTCFQAIRRYAEQCGFSCYDLRLMTPLEELQ